MPWVLPRYDQLLRDQRQLPESKRQSQIVLSFTKPIPRRMVSEFQRIHLTEAMLSGSEEKFYEANVFQPHRVRRKNCPLCGFPMDPVGPSVSKCRNKRCTMPETHEPTSQYEFHRGPLRGVVCVVTLPEFVVSREPRESFGQVWTDDRVDRALLILDRRYDAIVLAAIKRTAALICETWGWGLK